MARPSTLSRHVGSLLLIAALALLAISKEVLVPITLATLLAVLLTPVVRWLVSWRIPNLVAVVLVMGTLSASALMIGMILVGQISQVSDKLMEYRHNIHARMAELSSPRGTVSKATTTIQTLQRELGTLNGDEQGKIKDATSSSTKVKPQPVVIVDEQRIDVRDMMPLLANSLQPIAMTGLTLLLTGFMIMQRADIKKRFTILSEWMEKRGMSTISSIASEEMTARIGSYLLLQTALNIGAGVLITVMVALIGLPNALLWGLLTTLLRFVPYLGIVIAAGLTILFSVAVSPS